MQHLLRPLSLAAALALGAGAAHAQSSIHLGSYALQNTYTLDALDGMGLEASAVAYARDRHSLFFVGDEGLGAVEISLTGQTLGTMAFNWAGTGSTHNDAEGLTYLGNGQLVVVDERPQIAYSFSFASGTTLALNDQAKVAITGSTTSVKNVGTEGISYDPLTGSFFSVKQDTPVQLRQHTLSFAVGGGVATNDVLFTGTSSLFGVDSLSDLAVLSVVDSLAGTEALDNLLLLSLDSRKLLEVDRTTGTVLSELDLSGLTTQAIEGVTVDEKGTIYLVAEDSGTGASKLFVLGSTAAVPEPSEYALLLAGLAVLAAQRRRTTT